MTKTLTDNKKRCKYIADTLEQIAAGELYCCPECGEYITPREECIEGCPECPDVVQLICPQCEEEIDMPEQVSMFDYFSDYYNIEWRLDANREYKSVQVMVACGGPNIYVDTASEAVELYWWGDSAKWYVSRETVAALDEAFGELFYC